MIKAGDRVPSVPVRLVTASGTTESDTAAILGQGLVVLFAVPGAFTPTCDTSHLPGFVANASKMKNLGVTRIVCASANDHHVMKAWAERSDALQSIDFIADPHALFADALGLGKVTADLGKRYARFAMIIEDGKVQNVFVQDVAGVTVSGAPAILLALQGVAA
ncbi:MAG TPA: peroxiredoxin [Devosia sp.]|nr:peroxiredoxin [Devosia sp.]